MPKNLLTLLLLTICSFFSCAQQDLKTYEGNWKGTLSHADTFNFTITIEALASNMYRIKIANSYATINKELTIDHTGRITMNLDERTHLDLAFNDDRTLISGFIKSGLLMYHIALKKKQENLFQGTWNSFMIDRLPSQSIFLSFENYENGSFATYPFFNDQRFTGTWCGDFKRNGSIISFRDFKTGLHFKAKLLENNIQLEILLGQTTMAVTNLVRTEDSIVFEPLEDDQKITTPTSLNDGWTIGTTQELGIKMSPLNSMIALARKESLPNTHSVLIAKNGKLGFEAYFDGYHAHIPHDQRSASKSISSAMIGIAIDDKIMMGTDETLYDFIPETYQKTKDALKSKIKIQDLLTMSSGLDVDGIASEGSYQESDNWLKTVLEASMINSPGTHANYGSANPFLLGVGLNERLSYPLELYMDQKLFQPLGIHNYIIQTENTGTTPYFGGGMYLTPRDMLKFGQLYLHKGKWQGKQIISENWVKESFKKYLRLEDAKDKNEYGYLWWHKTYVVSGRKIESIEARGAGGQYIFVIPELASVVVITSGNYRNRKLLQQPEKILEEYILPAIMD